MAQLSSPGVAVTVVDESFYTPGAPGTVPLIIVASQQDKENSAGTGIAPGTTKANAGKVYLLTSQADLGATFGIPYFQTDASNNPVHAGELNEYGLQAAYSFLAVSNRAYVVRADLDTKQLIATATAPHGNPANGTLWFDVTDTNYGLFEWDNDPATVSGGQKFAHQTVAVINDMTLVDQNSGGPLSSVGSLGSYAVVTLPEGQWLQGEAIPVTIWYKTNNTASDGLPSNAGQWVVVGSHAWKASTPTVIGGTPDASLTGSFIINGYTYVASGASVTDLAAHINDNVSGITASVQNGVLNIYSDGSNMYGDVAGDVVLSGPWSSAGITSGTYHALALQLSPHYQIPTYKKTQTDNGYPSGSVWIKTTPVNQGAAFVIKKWNSATSTWVAQPVSLFPNGQSANAVLDPKGGGINLAEGTLYVKYNDGDIWDMPPTATYNIYYRKAVGPTKVTTNVITDSTFNSQLAVFQGYFDDGVGNTPGSTLHIISGTAPSIGDTITGPGIIGTCVVSGVVVTGTKFTVSGGDQTAGYANRPGHGSSNGATLTGAVPITMTLQASGINNNRLYPLNGPATVSLIGTGHARTDAFNLVTAIQQAMAGTLVTATLNPNNTITISHIAGGEIFIQDGENGILDSAVAVNPSNNLYADPNETPRLYIASLWTDLDNSLKPFAIPATTPPTTIPADGTLWYDNVVHDVDIMINDGINWVGYLTAEGRSVNYVGNGYTDPAGPTVSATVPTTQLGGTQLQNGDIWVSTVDFDNYPHIYKYDGINMRWVLVNNTDHTTENGIIFHDARWSTEGANSEPGLISDLLNSNYLDPDAPDPALYPKGMLLWNLRRSGNNVKRFVKNYIDTSATAVNDRFNGDTNAFPGGEPMGSAEGPLYYPHRWVSDAANDQHEVGQFGRKAQRAVVLQAIEALIESNQQIRDTDSKIFNLISCPGYLETLSSLIDLNTGRGESSFIVADSPARLTSDATTLSNWGNNVNVAAVDGEQGLVATNAYAAVYYPWGYTTDLHGNNIVVPPSHIMLRTIALSDNVSYPWFAPAGVRRGGVTNVSSVGYVDATTGEFITVALNNGQRDTLAGVHVNPITYLAGTGLVAYGQYTRQLVASSLDRINVARLVIFLRYQLNVIAKPFIFEPNDQITRNEIKQQIEKLLLELTGQRALYDYLVVCDTSNNTPARIDRSELWVDIAIEPVKAVEFIYIPLRLENTGAIKGLGAK